MMFHRRPALWPLVIAALIPRQAAAAAAFADRVLVGGRIITVDDADSVVEAFAIKDGRIVAVGTSAQILALAGPETETIDLHGLTATPGLLDAHCHFADGAVDRALVLDLSYPVVKSVADVVGRVKAEASKPGEWIQGRGWDEGKLAERRYILATDLDRVAPTRPVWLSQTMGHYGVANSVALKRAGITRDTPDPPNGTIDRDRDGKPTGVLKESAQALVARLIPPVNADSRKAAIRELAREFNKEGMTG